MESATYVSLVIKSALVREGLKSVLLEKGIHVEQSVASTEDLDESRCHEGSIIIYDTSLITLDVESFIRKAASCVRDHKIILLSEEIDLDLVSQAFHFGVHAYLVQDTDLEILVSIIHLVSLGEKVAPRELIDCLRIMPKTNANCDFFASHDLNERETAILKCLMAGMPNKLISREVKKSEATVKLTIKSIFRKLDVTNRTQAAVLAREAIELTMIGDDDDLMQLSENKSRPH